MVAVMGRRAVDEPLMCRLATAAEVSSSVATVVLLAAVIGAGSIRVPPEMALPLILASVAGAATNRLRLTCHTPTTAGADRARSSVRSAARASPRRGRCVGLPGRGPAERSRRLSRADHRHGCSRIRRFTIRRDLRGGPHEDRARDGNGRTRRDTRSSDNEHGGQGGARRGRREGPLRARNLAWTRIDAGRSVGQIRDHRFTLSGARHRVRVLRLSGRR